MDTFSEPDIYEVYLDEVNRNVESYQDIEIVSIHGPYKDLCLGSKDELIKSATRVRFESAYKISKLLNCQNIILNHGYIPGTSFPSHWVKRAKLFFDEFLSNKDSGILIHIENEFINFPINELGSGAIWKSINIINGRNRFLR